MCHMPDVESHSESELNAHTADTKSRVPEVIVDSNSLESAEHHPETRGLHVSEMLDEI